MVKNMVCFAIKGDNHYKELYRGMDGHKPYTMCFDHGSYAFCSRIYPLDPFGVITSIACWNIPWTYFADVFPI